MLFNSGVFLQFFAAFVLLFWLTRNSLAARNWLIVAASYLFYGWWDWRFLFLLFFSSSFDYAVGLGLTALRSSAQRKALLTGSIAVNLLILGFFKYWNFFADSFRQLLTALGLQVNSGSLDVILPVGISFYTFQSMSYAIDVYRGQMQPTRHFVQFLAYVAFFPQLVAGPIERAAHLLPQFAQTLRITRAMLEEGIWLMLWGMFKKVVIADNCAPLAEMVFGNSSWTAPMVTLGAVAFALQIYGDFSGYSDIARGLARVLGFDIMVNFNIPYAATGLRDFWRRWHISLSTWLRDYLYIPLGGNRKGEGRTMLNLLVTMVLGGLWHGAAWNFALWGAWHGLGLIAERIGSQRVSRSNPTTSGRRFLSWLGTMLFVLYGWLLFRASSLEQIGAMTLALADWRSPVWLPNYVLCLAIFSAPLVAMEIWQSKRGNLLAALTLARWPRLLLQGALLIGIVLFWEQEKTPFIYFQF